MTEYVFKNECGATEYRSSGAVLWETCKGMDMDIGEDNGWRAGCPINLNAAWLSVLGGPWPWLNSKINATWAES